MIATIAERFAVIIDGGVLGYCEPGLLLPLTGNQQECPGKERHSAQNPRANPRALVLGEHVFFINHEDSGPDSKGNEQQARNAGCSFHCAQRDKCASSLRESLSRSFGGGHRDGLGRSEENSAEDCLGDHGVAEEGPGWSISGKAGPKRLAQRGE